MKNELKGRNFYTKQSFKTAEHYYKNNKEEEKLLNYLNEYSVYKPSPKRIILSILDNIKNVNIHS